MAGTGQLAACNARVQQCNELSRERCPKTNALSKARHGHGHDGLSFFRQHVVKMNTPFISLCPETTRANALTLMDWLSSSALEVATARTDERPLGRSIATSPHVGTKPGGQEVDVRSVSPRLLG